MSGYRIIIDEKKKKYFYPLFFGVFFIILWWILPVLKPFIGAFILAFILNPAVKQFEKIKIPRSVASILVMLLLFMILIAVIIPLTLRAVNELVELKNYFAGDHVKSFFKSLPQNMKSLYTMVRVPESVKEQLDALVTDPQWIEKSGMKIISVMRSLLSSVTNRSAQFFMALSSSVFTLVLIPVIAFYILLEYDNVTESVFTVIPAKFRDDAKEIIDIFQGIFSSFFRGQLTVCAVIALLMSIGLYMTGLPYAVVIGIIAGIANIVPYLGAITGIILSLVTAFFSFNFSLFISKSIYIIIIYVLIQLMDNLVLSPRIIGDSVDLHPLVIMFVLMVGAYIADFGGLLFAVPAAAVLKALWKKYGPDLEKL